MTRPDELSLRQVDPGGPLRAWVDAERVPAARVWILFIHGFNVSSQDARDQFATLKGSSGKKLPERYGSAWMLVQWPSDRGRRPWSKFMYPALVPTAVAAGDRLGTFLRFHGPRRVVLVGHSLGALVALRAARRLGRRRVAGLALLSGAVQTLEFENDGRSRPPLARREAVGFNPLDIVLRAAFPVGERLAALGRRQSSAVGVHGQPSVRWQNPNRKFAGLGHGTWGDPLAGDVVHDAVGGRPRQLPERLLRQRRVSERRVPLNGTAVRA